MAKKNFHHVLYCLLMGFSFALPPKYLHRFSIACPSHVHRNDGHAMDYRWIIDGLSAKNERTCDLSVMVIKRKKLCVSLEI